MKKPRRRSNNNHQINYRKRFGPFNLRLDIRRSVDEEENISQPLDFSVRDRHPLDLGKVHEPKSFEGAEERGIAQVSKSRSGSEPSIVHRNKWKNIWIFGAEAL
jgi:hypothetical protein